MSAIRIVQYLLKFYFLAPYLCVGTLLFLWPEHDLLLNVGITKVSI